MRLIDPRRVSRTGLTPAAGLVLLFAAGLSFAGTQVSLDATTPIDSGPQERPSVEPPSEEPVEPEQVLEPAEPKEPTEALEEPELEDPGPGEPPEDPVAQPGDVWILGSHRVVCGDATDPDVMGLAVDGAQADGAGICTAPIARSVGRARFGGQLSASIEEVESTVAKPLDQV